MIRKILIANRGEIVNRIIRSAAELGIMPVVIASGSDSGLDYLESPVEKYYLQGSNPASAFLDGEKIIAIAKKCGADAIHPGYGFLAENASFAALCEKNNITWIGPSPEVMLKMSGKESSRQQAISAGVPVLPALTGTHAELAEQADKLTFPVLVKAVSGGGGRGMRIIENPEQFARQVCLASMEAERFFGDGRVFAEPYIRKAKHIEIQVMGDKHGNLVHLYERECTIQRRYQKIIEESPSPSLTEDQRHWILEDAVKLAKYSGYDNAGTLEFLLDASGRHYFMEMNTRIQVEHPVTEMVTGFDLVREQIQVAAGQRLSVSQENITTRGHAIECRICAEDPASGFDPRPGSLSLFKAPEGPGIRTEHACGNGFVVSPWFDSMIAKLIVHDTDREAALLKAQTALDQLVVHGVETTGEFIREILQHPVFTGRDFYTDFIQINSEDLLADLARKRSSVPDFVYQRAYQALNADVSENLSHQESNPWVKIGYWRQINSKAIEYQGKIRRIHFDANSAETNSPVVCSIHPDRSVWITAGGLTYRFTDPAITREPGNKPEKSISGPDSEDTAVYAPLPGLLSRLMVSQGDVVAKGDIVAVIESMKTENQILAATKGKIGTIRTTEGQQVRLNEVLMDIDII